VRGCATFVLLALLASSQSAFAADEAPPADAQPSTENKPAPDSTDGATPESIDSDPPPSTDSEPPESTDSEPPPSTGERALATGAAVVPGVLVHGMGHFVAGESTTGTRLLIGEGVGLGLLLGGGSVVVATGASRYVTGPAAATMMLGVGLFGTSFFADLYGSASPDAGAAGTRARPPPWIETELGYRHIGDPVFDYEHFLVERVSMMTGPLRLTPSAWISTDWDNARYRIEGAYRFVGATPSADQRAVLNDHVDAVLGLVQHRYVTERFKRSTMEVAVDTRYDLGHVGPTLAGAFVEAGVGYGFGRIDYDIEGTPVPADFDDLLLGRLGFGAVFRGLAHPGSEARLYYDHRHDDFAGGLLLEGIPSGIAGHFGAEARWFFTPKIGLAAQAEVGAAFVAGASFIFRQSGASPWSDERRQE
jgi:hypothetical protein